MKTYRISCRLSYRWTSYEKLIDINRYDLYFYSLTATFVWSRNTVRESSHISIFLWRGANRFAWAASGSPPLLERPADLLPSLERPANLSLSPKYRPYCLFKSHAGIWTDLFARVFSVYGWFSELTYFRFFPVICWSYLWTEISLTLSIRNKLYS